MRDLQSSIRDAITAARHDAFLLAAKSHRFGWAEGHSTLYKFMSLGGDGFGYVTDVLTNSKVYFSAPDQLNDPTDCKPVFKLAKDLSDKAFYDELQAEESKMIAEKKLSSEEIEKLHAEYGVKPEKLAEAVTEHTRLELGKVTRIYCVTSNPRNELMWAHYAERHTGVCLHFDSRNGAMCGHARGVIYSDDREPILIPLDYNHNKGAIVDRMVFAKSSAWAYEKEYRIISHENIVADYPMEGRYVKFDSDQLIGISFGMRIDPDHRRELTRIVDARATRMRRYDAVDSDGFSVEFKSVP